MASKASLIAHLHLAELAEVHGISQSKVKEIAFGLLDKNLEATPELIAQVVEIYTQRQCDPLLAIDHLANEYQQVNPQNQSADPLAQTIQTLSDQVYDSLSPIADQVRDNVTARLAVNILGSLCTSKKQGQNTKAVFSTFTQMVKSVALEAPNLQRQISAVGNDDFLSLPSASGSQPTVTEVA